MSLDTCSLVSNAASGRAFRSGNGRTGRRLDCASDIADPPGGRSARSSTPPRLRLKGSSCEMRPARRRGATPTGLRFVGNGRGVRLTLAGCYLWKVRSARQGLFRDDQGGHTLSCDIQLIARRFRRAPTILKRPPAERLKPRLCCRSSQDLRAHGRSQARRCRCRRLVVTCRCEGFDGDHEA